MGLFDKLFGTRSQREVKKLQPTVDKILALEEEYKALSEEALKAKTPEFKERHKEVFHGNMEGLLTKRKEGLE